MMMDSAIIWIYFRISQPPISFTVAALLFKDTLAITLANLLKQNLRFASNIFSGPFNVDFAAVKAFLVIISSSTSSSSGGGGGGGDGSGNDRTSSCGKVVVVKSWPEQVNNKLEARATKCKFVARATKHKSEARTSKHKFGARALKYKLVAKAGKYKLGRRSGK